MVTLKVCIHAVLIGLLLLWSPAVGQDSTSLPLKYNLTVLEGDGTDTCPPDGQARADIIGDVRTVIQDVILPLIEEQPSKFAGPILTAGMQYRCKYHV